MDAGYFSWEAIHLQIIFFIYLLFKFIYIFFFVSVNMGPHEQKFQYDTLLTIFIRYETNFMINKVVMGVVKVVHVNLLVI